MKLLGTSGGVLPDYFKPYGAVVISGASSGIGLAFLEELSRLNPKLAVFNLSRHADSSFAGYANLTHMPCDLTDAEELRRAYAAIAERLAGIKGKLLLVNNSGFGGYGFFPSPGLEHNLSMIDLNIRALTHLTGLFLPELKNRGGAVVNVCSTAAWQPCPRLNVYAATKAYVMSFSLALGRELSYNGVRVLCLCPGPTSTNFFKAAGFEKRPLPNSFGHNPGQVARAALKALASGKSLKVVGILNSVSARLAGFLPKTVSTAISDWILSKIRAD